MNPESSHTNRYFAVIDTETNWNNEVMSVGIAIADTSSFEASETLYYIITPECMVGGMFSSVLYCKNADVNLKGSRSAVLNHLIGKLKAYDIEDVFAYNALFDYSHMPEMQDFRWYDIIKTAAYKQYNRFIPEDADCCKTGKLKHNYGVEPILRLLTNDRTYREVHNAVCDAVDELKIMKLLELDIETYQCARINAKSKK